MFFGIVLVRKWFTTDYLIIRCRHSGQNLSAKGSTDCIHQVTVKPVEHVQDCPKEQTLLLPDHELLEMSLCGRGGCMLRASRTEQPLGHPNLYCDKPLDTTALRWRLRWCTDTLVCTKLCLDLCCDVFPSFSSGSCNLQLQGCRVCSKLWAVYTFLSLVQSVTILTPPSYLYSCISLALPQNWAVSQKQPNSLRLQTLEWFSLVSFIYL